MVSKRPGKSAVSQLVIVQNGASTLRPKASGRASSFDFQVA